MPTLKLSSAGSVILKNGSPSCTCCGPCSPDVDTVYVEYTEDPYGLPETAYFTLTGSLNAGLFEGSGAELRWVEEDGQWAFTPPGDVVPGLGPIIERCDPQGIYELMTLWIATVSFTPLP